MRYSAAHVACGYIVTIGADWVKRILRLCSSSVVKPELYRNRRDEKPLRGKVDTIQKCATKGTPQIGRSRTVCTRTMHRSSALANTSPPARNEALRTCDVLQTNDIEEDSTRLLIRS